MAQRSMRYGELTNTIGIWIELLKSQLQLYNKKIRPGEKLGLFFFASLTSPIMKNFIFMEDLYMGIVGWLIIIMVAIFGLAIWNAYGYEDIYEEDLD